MSSLQNVFVILTTTRWISEVFVAVAVLQGLVAIWLALGHGKWFVRAILAIAMIGSLVAVRAFLPAVLFGVSSILTLAMLWLLRLRTRKFQRQSTTQAVHSAIVFGSIAFACVVAYCVVAKCSSVYFVTGWHENFSLGITVGCFVTVATVRLIDRFTNGPDRLVRLEPASVPQSVYSLGDLLTGATLSAIFVAMLASSLRRSGPLDVPAFLSFACLLAIINCVVCGIVMSVTWRWRILSTIGCGAVIIAAAFAMQQPMTDWLTQFYLGRPSTTVATASTLLIGGGFVTLAAGVFLLHQARFVQWHPVAMIAEIDSASGEGVAPVRPRRFFQAASLLVLATVFLTLAPLFTSLTGTLVMPPTTAQNVRDYKELAKALTSVATLNSQSQSIAGLRANGKDAAANWLEECYATINQLVDQGVGVDIGYSQESGSVIPQRWDDVKSARVLTRAWIAETTTAPVSTSADDLLDWPLRLIRFGNRMAHGGELSHSLVGVASETAGQESLLAMIPQLSNASRRTVVDCLNEIDADREPLSLTITRDQACLDKRDTWHFRIQRINEIYATSAATAPPNAWSPVLEALTAALNRRDAACRMLILHAAIESFHEKEGRYPQRLGSLIPKFLKALPVDPYSGESFLYQVSDDSFLVFSQRDSPDGLMLPRDEATDKYLWTAAETIQGVRKLPKKNSNR